MRSFGKLSFAGVSLMALSVPAYAQDGAATDTAASKDDIIVTGTLIRGVAPAGTNVVSVSKEAVEATGATTTSQLLQTIPQMGSFNDLQRQIGGGNFVTSNRPNLRDFPGFTTKGSAATLMLVDGHRVVGMGISVTNPDVDIVPPGIIERVEVVPDGGSAMYGSDAVAGVINFITRKNFNGIEANARYGFGETNYHTFDANFTAGHSWDRGNVFISYNYAENSTFYGRDRDFVRIFPANVAGVPIPITQIECPGGTVRNLFPGGSTYALPYPTGAGVAGTANQCDLSDPVSVYPENQRHTVYAGVSQDLSDSVKFDVRGFFMTRKTYQSLGIYHSNANIGPTFVNPAFTPFPGQSTYFFGTGPFEIHNVTFGWGPDNGLNQTIKLDTWGITPTITADLGKNWQLRVLADYGESTTEQHSPGISSTALTNAIRAGLFNPYNVSLSNPTALAAVTNFENFGRTNQTQFTARAIIDGDLATLPGGALKLAAGAEYLKATMDVQRGTTIPGFESAGFPGQMINGTQIIPVTPAVPLFSVGRSVVSLFGELVAPIFSSENRTGGFEELTLSLSGRYDRYSDVGSTFNPKFGLTWRPTEWLRLRGSWGKSFAAPSLADTDETDPKSVAFINGGTFGFLVPTATVVANGYPAPTAANSNGIVLLGSKGGSTPERATTFSIGGDLTPIDGLRLSVTYWNIKYRDLIVQAPFTATSSYFSTFGGTSFVINPTQAQIDAAIAPPGSLAGTLCAPTPSCVYIIEDNRKTNLGRFQTDGLDMELNYRTETSFGSVDFNANGTYILGRANSATATSPLVSDEAANRSRFFMRTSLGANIHNLRAQVTWNHRHGYGLNPVIPAAGGFPVQDRVGSYNVFDLFFKYDFAGDRVMKDLSLTLGVNNVFSQDPPELRRQQITLNTNGFDNGNTVGRVVQVGISKRF
jgi:iron complex outermembrane receptor protein